jgi:hypothetical protein
MKLIVFRLVQKLRGFFITGYVWLPPTRDPAQAHWNWATPPHDSYFIFVLILSYLIHQRLSLFCLPFLCLNEVLCAFHVFLTRTTCPAHPFPSNNIFLKSPYYCFVIIVADLLLLPLLFLTGETVQAMRLLVFTREVPRNNLYNDT